MELVSEVLHLPPSPFHDSVRSPTCCGISPQPPAFSITQQLRIRIITRISDGHAQLVAVLPISSLQQHGGVASHPGPSSPVPTSTRDLGPGVVVHKSFANYESFASRLRVPSRPLSIAGIYHAPKRRSSILILRPHSPSSSLAGSHAPALAGRLSQCRKHCLDAAEI